MPGPQSDPTEIKVIEVPNRLAEDLERALGIIRDEVKLVNPNIKDSDIVLERQTHRGMLGGFGGEAFLYVSALVATTMTKKWIEEVLWPRLKPMIEQHSNEVFDLLVRIMKNDDNMKKET